MPPKSLATAEMASNKRKRDDETDDTKRTRKLFHGCDYKSTTDVLVGSEEEPFVVYEDVICASSKFFKAACSVRWVEGKEKKVSLPEVEPELFQSYVAWLYSGEYKLQAPKDDSEDAYYVYWDESINLYLLGDVLDDVRFRNKTMEAIVFGRPKYLPAANLMCTLWERTPSTSIVRKMFVETAIMRLDRDDFAHDVKVHAYSAEFLEDFALASSER